MRYYILDLERNMLWKPNKRGYTSDYKLAGIYSEEEANDIVKSDYDKKSRKIEEEVILKLFSK